MRHPDQEGQADDQQRHLLERPLRRHGVDDARADDGHEQVPGDDGDPDQNQHPAGPLELAGEEAGHRDQLGDAGQVAAEPGTQG